MPSFILMLLAGLATVMGSLVGRVLVALGIGYVSYTGLNVLFSQVEAQVAGMYSGVPAQALAVLGTLQVDVCINILLSAFAARLVLMGVGPSGIVTRMLIK